MASEIHDPAATSAVRPFMDDWCFSSSLLFPPSYHGCDPRQPCLLIDAQSARGTRDSSLAARCVVSCLPRAPPWSNSLAREIVRKR